MKQKALFSLILCIFSLANVIAQPTGYEPFGNVYESGSSKIELWIKKPKISCGINSKSFKYILIPTNLNKKAFTNNAFISWRIDVRNCEGNNLSYFFSVDVKDFLNYSDPDQHWEKMDWNFFADSITSSIYAVNQTRISLNEKNILNERLEPPLGISGPSTIVKPQNIRLSITGGNLSGNSKWFWYKDDCENGVFIGNGSEISDFITKKTTYYARARDNKKSSVCANFTVDIDSSSVPPSKILVNDGDLICDGVTKPKTLKVTDGRLGADAEWVWYTDEIKPQNKIATNTTEINVLPKKTTYYIVRAENKYANYSQPVGISIKVISKSIQPTSIESNANNGFICEGENLILSVKGGTLSEGAKYNWESIDIDGNVKKLGSGESITTIPYKNSVYSVIISSICELNPLPISLKVDLQQRTVSPSTYDIKATLNKSKSSYLIAIPDNAGKLGTAAKWVWYSDAEANNMIGDGYLIKSKSNKEKTIYVRGEGACNNSELISKLLYSVKSNKFVYFNVGVPASNILFDTSRISNLVLTIGSQGFYLKASLGIVSAFGVTPGEVNNPLFEYDGKTIVNYPRNSGTYYQFNNKYYSDLDTYILGLMAGKKAIKIFVGAGYGTYRMVWGVNTYDYVTNRLLTQKWANHTSKSLSGPSFETGLFLKLGFINITGTINGIYSSKTKQNHLSGQLGLGLNIRY
jgi:hypothetical protein